MHSDVTRVVFDQSRPLVVFVAQHDCEVVGLHQLEVGAQQAIREPAVRAAHVCVETVPLPPAPPSGLRTRSQWVQQHPQVLESFLADADTGV